MDFLSRGRNGDDAPSERIIDQGVQMCPFLRNITETTNFFFASPIRVPTPVKGGRGPIFEDGPSFETAFRLFHGRDGVVPLSGRSLVHISETLSDADNTASAKFHPFAASAATVSLSAFGPGGPFGFDFFMGEHKHNKKNNKRRETNEKKKSDPLQEGQVHEATGIEWLETGNCPIAKSYQAVSKVVPLVAKLLQPPPGMKIKCPPAVVAARAALARTPLVKSLRPKPLPAKMLAIGLLGMAVNVPLGVWREHTQKFSPAWFVAIHSAIPFIAMLRKSVNMPKSAMAFTIAASILGQVIGSRAEKARLKHSTDMPNVVDHTYEHVKVDTKSPIPATVYVSIDEKGTVNHHCGAKIWDSAESINTSSDPVSAY
jgi:hypothetical protein